MNAGKEPSAKMHVDMCMGMRMGICAGIWIEFCVAIIPELGSEADNQIHLVADERALPHEYYARSKG